MRSVMSLALIAGSSIATQAIDLKQGIATDTWVTWPDVSNMPKSQFVDVFPEWRRGTSATEIAALRKAGFDFVRLTIDPVVFLHKPDAKRTKRLLAQVKVSTNLFLSAGLNVIVDLHSIPRNAPEPGTESYLRSAADFNQYVRVAKQVAATVAQLDPARVAFEPFNEPTIDCPWDAKPTRRWPAMAVKLHKAVRAVAPKHAIVLQGGCWGSATGLVALKPKAFTDKNIIWSFHNYAPMIFTHQGASWTSWVEPYVEGLSFPSDAREKKSVLARGLTKINAAKILAGQKATLRAQLSEELDNYFAGAGEIEFKAQVDMVKAWAVLNKIPAKRILAGEFGAIRGDLSEPLSDTKRAPYLRYCANAYRSQGWGWSVWEWGGSFGLTVSDSNRTPIPILTQALGLKPRP